MPGSAFFSHPERGERGDREKEKKTMKLEGTFVPKVLSNHFYRGGD